jgi:RHH-type rel operon transcriptional repressor/antitoxin RelB
MTSQKIRALTNNAAYALPSRAIGKGKGRTTVYYGVLFSIMDKTVSFRTDSKKVKALDALASMQDRDRSYLLNQAVDSYLDLQLYHIELIEKGIRQADAGELVDHSDVAKIVAKLRRKK